MRSIVALVLACWMLGGSLLPGFGIDQSAHLGDLVQHYQQHRKANSRLSFVDFLNMHYGADSEHQKHPNHSHQNLPTSGHAVPAYTPAAVRLVVPSFQMLLLPSTKFFGKADLYSFLSVFALINPPRK